MAGESHERPDGWREFLNRLAGIECVSSIRYDGKGPKQADRSKIYEKTPESGALGVVYKNKDVCLPICVETTACGSAQVELVKGWITRNVLSGSRHKSHHALARLWDDLGALLDCAPQRSASATPAVLARARSRPRLQIHRQIIDVIYVSTH
ncbi:MAG: hypothetical protein HYU64_07285 [Armatimonadetes bacterium]|nr:hypothetical protein [Armatimonadota bacterium]